MKLTIMYAILMGLPRWLSGKRKSSCQYRRCRRCWFNPWVRKISWMRKWQPTPVVLPGESHGQRSMADYSPWGCTESDMTEHAMPTHRGFKLDRCAQVRTLPQQGRICGIRILMPQPAPFQSFAPLT